MSVVAERGPKSIPPAMDVEACVDPTSDGGSTPPTSTNLKIFVAGDGREGLKPDPAQPKLGVNFDMGVYWYRRGG